MKKYNIYDLILKLLSESFFIKDLKNDNTIEVVKIDDLKQWCKENEITWPDELPF